MNEKLLVSIIIPAKNEAQSLPRLLKSIKKQNYQPYEIILADNDSEDNTIEIAKKYGVKVVKGGMPSVGRNRGADIAQAEALIFMDADTYFLNENDLKEIYDKFQKKGLDIASCYFNGEKGQKSTQYLMNVLKWIASRRVNLFLKGDFGAFIIVKKDAFDRVNGFDENLLVTEDSNIVRRLSRLGYLHGMINEKIGITLGLDKRGDKRSMNLKIVIGAIIGYISILLSGNQVTKELAYKLNKKAHSLHGELGGIIDYQNPYSPDDRCLGYPSEASNAERRFWEIAVGLLTWICLLIPIFLAIFRLEKIFIIYIAFLVAYWLVRTVKFVAGIAVGYKRYQEEVNTDWISKINKKYPEEFKKLKFIYLCPVYSENLDILESSFKAFADSNVGADKINVVFAIEEKKADFQIKNFEYLKREFGNKFKSMQYYVHPAGIPGEIAGVKGANINWAIRHYVKELERRGENLNEYLVVTCDSDLRPHPKYLSAVAYKYFENGDHRDNYYYASALHTFRNNIWDVPHVIRVQSNMLTLVLLYAWVMDKKKVIPFKGEEIYIRDTFSSYIVNLEKLREFKFWDPEIANDDTAFYCNAMVRSKGTFKSQEVYIPTYNDAVQNSSYWKSHVSYYKQQHRWGWGTINVPTTYAAIAHDNENFPFLRKLAIFQYLFETQIWYISVVFVLTFGLFLMGIINPSYNFTAYAYNLAQLMSVAFTFITFLNIPLILYRRKIVPVPEGWSWWRNILDYAEVVFITVNMLTFGFIPYIQAKTELMLGLSTFKRNFYVTEKVRTEKVSEN